MKIIKKWTLLIFISLILFSCKEIKKEESIIMIETEKVSSKNYMERLEEDMVLEEGYNTDSEKTKLENQVDTLTTNN